MNKIKVNLDKPKVSLDEIQSNMNFDKVLGNYSLLHKPFYKSPWFFGVTGVASLGLIIGTSHFLDLNQIENDPVITESKQDVAPKTNLLAFNDKVEDPSTNGKEKNYPIKNEEQFKIAYEEKTTTASKINIENNTEVTVPTEIELDKVKSIKEDEKNILKTFNYIDLHPRIANKLNGFITKEELFDDNGLVTAADIKITHFELHLIDGTGGKVYESSSNKLNSEMIQAIKKVNKGEEIFFEKIEGESNKGEILRLSPLKYTLLN